jgi:hypothetical protein
MPTRGATTAPPLLTADRRVFDQVGSDDVDEERDGLVVVPDEKVTKPSGNVISSSRSLVAHLRPPPRVHHRHERTLDHAAELRRCNVLD